MQASDSKLILKNTWIMFLLTFTLFTYSCKKKEITQNITYDNLIYDLDTTNLYASSAEKSRQKTSSQYTSILYSDLFATTIPINDMNNIEQLTLSIGDKQLANELVVNAAMTSSGLVAPTNAEMRADIPKFIKETYIRFYLRKPTEMESYYLTKMIQDDPTLTPEHIYLGFTLSNEYLFY